MIDVGERMTDDKLLLPSSVLRLLSSVFLAAALLARPAAAGMPAGLVVGERVAVAAALDGATLRLEDGRELKLLGIEAPQESLVPHDAALDALVAQARAALAQLAEGKTAVLYAEERDGSVAAQVEIAGLWLQGELLTRGLARVHTMPGHAAGATVMLRLEEGARQARRGIWTHPAFALRPIGELDHWVDTFQIVEGRLAAVGSDEGRTILSFVEEASDVLTVVVPAAAQARFRAAGIDFNRLTGWRGLRLRGLVLWRDGGPYMELEDPAQLEQPGG
jgi:endonuclease YncB( thermonuclease family)